MNPSQAPTDPPPATPNPRLAPTAPPLPPTSTPLAIVLAAGKGTRMKSELPKVLLPVAGRPMLLFVLDALRAAGVTRIVVVVGYRGDLVRELLRDTPDVEFVEQPEQLGTGHAVGVCREQLAAHQGPVVVVAGDSPMLRTDSVQKLLAAFAETRAACILGTLHKPNPTGLGRIVRDADQNFSKIVEERDADERQRQITEVNMSTYVFDSRHLIPALQQLRSDNRQREYYLTDCPAILKGQGHEVRALAVLQPCEALSVNSPDELAAVETELRKMGH
jgi:bifunctional UDP-N-acetylglucosamine pyrophosphorylase/glucosamine-1-phosphate N-acetyltransferase